jgi:hypothetical protein
MLKYDESGSSGQLPPELPNEGPGMTVVQSGPAANEGAWDRNGSLARRQRRHQRAVRARGRGRGGWSLALW